VTRLALIGDSHAEVLFPLLRPALEAQGFTAALTDARRGWSEASYLRDATFAARLRAAEPRAALVHLGGNNLALTDAAYADTARRLLLLLKGAGVQQVYWIGPYVATSSAADAARRHEVTATLQARLLPALAAETGLPVRWLDTRPFSRTGHSDGIHFTRAAYQDFGRRIAGWLQTAPGAGSGRGAMIAGVTAAGLMIIGALLLRRKA
jgi:lysophospholipase L1-like esterase